MKKELEMIEQQSIETRVFGIVDQWARNNTMSDPPVVICREVNLADLKMDSLDVVELVIQIETAFSVQLHDDAMLAKTVGDVIDAAEKALATSPLARAAS